MRVWDTIVAGLGGMGSAAAYHLARRGGRVLGLDAFARGHDRGSSHGRSRIIREAYFESPDYVVLVRRAYRLWRELERESGRTLLRITGGLWMGAPDSDVVAGSLASARLHSLQHELLTAPEIERRFPQFRLPPSAAGVYEPNAGILDPEACVAAHLDLAARHGAELHHSEPVLRWSANAGGVRVETAQGIYAADRLIVTAGAWAGELLAELRLPLEVERVFVVHFEPDDPSRFAPDRCPLYLWRLNGGHFYGFPYLEGQGIKFGQHGAGEITKADRVRRSVTDGEIEQVRAVLNRVLPGAGMRADRAVTCLYTNTPDGHFFVDRHPEHENVWIACGFCGHGFKFASVVGEIMADLAFSGATGYPIEFLSLRRLG